MKLCEFFQRIQTDIDGEIIQVEVSETRRAIEMLVESKASQEEIEGLRQEIKDKYNLKEVIINLFVGSPNNPKPEKVSIKYNPKFLRRCKYGIT